MKSRLSDKDFSGNVIYKLLNESNEPLFWGELVARAKQGFISNIRVLRKDFRELKRSGRVYQDEKGSYSLVDSKDLLRGSITRYQNVFRCDGYEVITDSKIKLREGDEIEGMLRDDKIVLVSVIKLSAKPLVGVVSLMGKDCVVESLDRDLKGKFFLPIESLDQSIKLKIGDTVEVQPIDQVRGGFSGVFLKKIEGASVLDQAITTIIKSFEIPLSWSSSLQSSVNLISEDSRNDQFDARTDLTELSFVTIDGETAKDFDDAVYAEIQHDKSYRVLVAIADVCHYVKSGSPMDMEARKRGTSVYFPGTVVPMLPETLSNDLCSLKEQCDRPVLVCDMNLSPEGALQNFDFYEALICSKARLTYSEVHAYLSSGASSRPLSSAVQGSLDALYRCYLGLGEIRFDRGALDFSTTEAALTLSGGAIESIVSEEKYEAHKLIEEMMLLTNVCAAEFLQTNSVAFLFRNHEKPDLMKLEQLKQTLNVSGFTIDFQKVSPKSFQDLLFNVLSRPKGEIYQQLILKSLQQAVYEPDKKGHFGLALESYTHFTSPIRRYPDLLVHRAIKGLLNKSSESGQLPYDELVDLGIGCSETERRAEFASWAVDNWLKCDFLLDRVGDTIDGWIAGVTDFGLFVELEGYFVQGLLHVTNLGNDYYRFVPNSLALVGESSGRAFRFGESIQVKIEHIEVAQGKIELHLPQARSSKKGRQKRKGRRRLKRAELG
ncbi:ribonuclease R [Gammaproteobacteria bacterium]|nr:ribonuclease R [Gammaproteobacteria bacterium]